MEDSKYVHDADLLEEKPASRLENTALNLGCLVATPVIVGGGAVLTLGAGLCYMVNEAIQQGRRFYFNLRGKPIERVEEDNIFPYYRIRK